MYKIRSIWSSKKMAELSKKGIELSPHHGGLHDTFSVSQSGPEFDFKKKSHHKVISYYKNYISKDLDNFIARRVLITNLIDRYRFDEAEEEICKASIFAKDKKYLMEILEGEIHYKKGNHAKAIKRWEEVLQSNPNNYSCSYLVADQFATFARYDEALKYYQQSYKLQEKPRKIDGLEAMLQIYEMRDDNSKILSILNEIIDIYKEDYNIGNDENSEARHFYESRNRLLKETD